MRVATNQEQRKYRQRTGRKFVAKDLADAKALKLHAAALSKISVPKLHSRVNVLEAQKRFGEYVNWVLLQLGTAIHMAVLDAEYANS